MLLEGVHVPLTTPFYPDGKLYLRKLEHNVRRYSLTPVSGLIALGDGSEVASLGHAEQREILRTVAEAAAPEKVLTATLNDAGCLPALRLAERAADMRFDVLLLAPPVQWSGNQDLIATWFRVIADQAALPCLLSSHCGGAPLPVPFLADLASHPNVFGVLESSSHISRVADLRAAVAAIHRDVKTTITFTAATARMLEPAPPETTLASTGFVSAEMLASAGTSTASSANGSGAATETKAAAPGIRIRTKQVGSQVLWASATEATEALRAGATAIATAVAASVPQAVFEIWAAWKDGDNSLMREKQARVAAIEPALLASGAPLLKAAADLSGYFGGRPRLPFVAPTAAQLDELAKSLDGIRS